MPLAIPVSLNLASIGVDIGWWLESSQRAEEAGFDAVLIWDHFVSRGDLTDPVLECWTTIAAAAAVTQTINVGSFVTNLMNRHPAVLARIVATAAELTDARIELGIGIGGHPAEHVAYGIDFPERPERAARLDEALTVLQLLLGGGPADFAGEFYQLEGAYAFPVPRRAPRITVSGTTPAGARLAGRRADAWTCFADQYDRLLPTFNETLAAQGRDRADVDILVGLDFEDVAGGLAATADRWAERGADGLIIHDVRGAQLDTLIETLPD